MAAINQHQFFQETPPYRTTYPQTKKTTEQRGSVVENSPKQVRPLEYWSYLILTLGVASVGVALIPHFALGLAVGVVNVFSSLIIVVVMELFITSRQEEEYSDFIEKYPSSATLGAPFIEELIFRGGMQSLLTLAFLCLAPGLAAIPFLGTSLNVAVGASLIATSLAFGLAHFSKQNYSQVVMATFTGIVFGLLALQFGLAVSMAAHVAQNTLAVTATKFFKEPEVEKPSKTEGAAPGMTP